MQTERIEATWPQAGSGALFSNSDCRPRPKRDTEQLRFLRTAFYPVINNMNAAYLIRMGQPGGKELVQTPDQAPLGADRDFVNHRTAFLMDLIKYTDLKEVIILRQKILDNAFHGAGSTGPITTSLVPEAQAISECMQVLHRKLKLDPMLT
jgi:hypothetical protein